MPTKSTTRWSAGAITAQEAKALIAIIGPHHGEQWTAVCVDLGALAREASARAPASAAQQFF